MEKQMSFAQAEYAGKKRVTKREKFLRDMERVVPWKRLVELIEPYYPKGERGRPPVGIERMLRIYFLQQWYALSDEGLEDAIYDSQAMRTFAGVDLGSEPVPDATTLLNFRHLLERHGLTKGIFDRVGAMLEEKNILMREGTIVDATLIAAPSSTKNQSGGRDPQMRQVKKGNQWYFGMKAHVGTDAQSGIVHTLVGTAANVADVKCAPALLHGKEKTGYGDAGYTGAGKQGGRAGNLRWEVAMKRGKLKTMAEGEIKDLTRQLEHLKARVRAKVEHAFHVVKNLFGYRKVRYRGLFKNTAQLHTLFALANLVLAKGKLLAETAA
jgi:IS5 family transposase